VLIPDQRPVVELNVDGAGVWHWRGEMEGPQHDGIGGWWRRDEGGRRLRRGEVDADGWRGATMETTHSGVGGRSSPPAESNNEDGRGDDDRGGGGDDAARRADSAARP
jgi:hypothetical protein